MTVSSELTAFSNGEGAHLSDICSCHKRASFAGQYHNSDIFIGIYLVEHIKQLLKNSLVEGIQGFRPVYSHIAYGIFDFVLDRLIHKRTSFLIENLNIEIISPIGD